MAQAVADASSLIHLEKIKQLGLLERLFGAIAIPQAVAREVQRGTLPELPAWIRVHTLKRPIPSSIAKLSLGPGESETMALALESQIPRVILDDLAARELGRSLGLEIVGHGLPIEPEGLPDAPHRGWRGGVKALAPTAVMRQWQMRRVRRERGPVPAVGGRGSLSPSQTC